MYLEVLEGPYQASWARTEVNQRGYQDRTRNQPVQGSRKEDMHIHNREQRLEPQNPLRTMEGAWEVGQGVAYVRGAGVGADAGSEGTSVCIACHCTARLPLIS